MPETKQKPRRRRRWLRYSLRSFFVVLTIFCVALGYWVHRAKRQQAAVKWVIENGGIARYDFEFDEKGDNIDNAKPSGPKWLQAFLGNDYFGTVVHVDLSASEVKDVTPLAQLGHLEHLNLWDTQVSNLSPLSSLKSLKYLFLDDTQVSDLSPLTHLTRLESLTLGSTQVSDLTPLAGMTRLKWLPLDDTQVRDLTPLAGLSNLRILDLNNTQVRDITPLTGLTNLESLSLDNTQFTQEQIDVLQKASPNCVIYGLPAGKAIEGK